MSSDRWWEQETQDAVRQICSVEDAEALRRQSVAVGRSPKEWDYYYMTLAYSVSLGVKCSSRQIGTVLVGRDNRIISTGYNGAPPDVKLCQDVEAPCPRRVLGYESGEGLHVCPATHAETNAIASAARMGHSTKDGTLFCWCCMPCVNCTSVIISSGISRVVYLDREKKYHELSEVMFRQAGVVLDGYDRQEILDWACQQGELHEQARRR
jgi:dCMP deaminase